MSWKKLLLKIQQGLFYKKKGSGTEFKGRIVDEVFQRIEGNTKKIQFSGICNSQIINFCNLITKSDSTPGLIKKPPPEGRFVSVEKMSLNQLTLF
jgi:hypothetical protein